MFRSALYAARRMAQGSHRGKTITLKLRYSDFSTHTRSHTLDRFTDSETEIYAVAARLLEEHPRAQPFRLLGISVSNLDAVQVGEGGQLTLEF